MFSKRVTVLFVRHAALFAYGIGVLTITGQKSDGGEGLALYFFLNAVFGFSYVADIGASLAVNYLASSHSNSGGPVATFDFSKLSGDGLRVLQFTMKFLVFFLAVALVSSIIASIIFEDIFVLLVFPVFAFVVSFNLFKGLLEGYGEIDRSLVLQTIGHSIGVPCSLILLFKGLYVESLMAFYCGMPAIYLAYVIVVRGKELKDALCGLNSVVGYKLGLENSIMRYSVRVGLVWLVSYISTQGLIIISSYLKEGVFVIEFGRSLVLLNQLTVVCLSALAVAQNGFGPLWRVGRTFTIRKLVKKIDIINYCIFLASLGGFLIAVRFDLFSFTVLMGDGLLEVAPVIFIVVFFSIPVASRSAAIRFRLTEFYLPVGVLLLLYNATLILTIDDFKSYFSWAFVTGILINFFYTVFMYRRLLREVDFSE